MTEPNYALIEQQLIYLTEMMRENQTSLEKLRDGLAHQFVSKGEYAANRVADDRRMAELEKDNDARDGFNRQVLAGMAVLLLSVLILGAGFLNNMGGGG